MLYSNIISNKNVVQKKKKRKKKRANRDMQNTTQKTQDRGARTPTTPEDELRSTGRAFLARHVATGVL